MLVTTTPIAVHEATKDSDTATHAAGIRPMPVATAALPLNPHIPGHLPPQHSNSEQTRNDKDMLSVPCASHLRADAACGLSLIIAPRFFRGFFFSA
jgi:hypothetical protein